MIVISAQHSLGCLSRLWASFHANNRSKDACFFAGSLNLRKRHLKRFQRFRHLALQNFRRFEAVTKRLKQTGHVTCLNSTFKVGHYFHLVACVRARVGQVLTTQAAHFGRFPLVAPIRP
jgi:hypothetical protein